MVQDRSSNNHLHTCCVVGHGATLLTLCVLPTDSIPIHTIGLTSLDFAVWQDRIPLILTIKGPLISLGAYHIYPLHSQTTQETGLLLKQEHH